jgi:rod shape-determining protein MreC
MKKKRSRKQEDIMLGVGALIVIILLVISLSIDNDNGFILKDVSMFIEKIVMLPITKDNKVNTKSYIIEKNSNEELKKEIVELKKALELNKTLTEYDPVNATILSRNKSYWFNTLTIDKGKNSGIKKNMAVITKDGLIGKISKVSHNSSEVKLITSDDVNFKISVAIKTPSGDSYAVLNGYDKEKNLIKVTGIDKTTSINKGDIVLTSGLGEMFPAGIYIGEVEEIESDKYNLSKIVYIKTSQNFNDVHDVTVLKVK